MTRRTTAAEEGAAKPPTPKAARKPAAPKAVALPVEPVESGPQPPLTQRLARPQSVEEAEVRYVAARDAWTAAMRAANSGRPADLASLAIAQEAYEAAVAERDRWHTGTKVAIPVESETRSAIEAAAGQEIAWRQVLHPDQPKGGVLSRIRRRLTGG
jgi:hypothetical protein